MGINFDAGGKFDGSFNEGTWNGFSQAIEELSSENSVETLEFEGTPDTFANGLREMANQGADLIVAPGFAQGDAIMAISSEFPDTKFVIIDALAEAPNVRSVLFREHEGSFLVGYIAGRLSQTGVVGFVGGMEIPLIQKFNVGYEDGVKKACPECKVISNYIGVTPEAWSDPAKAKELAALQHGQGVDIIYTASGASGTGVIDFVNETMCYKPDSLGIDLRDTSLTQAVANMAKSADYSANCVDAQPLFFIGVDINQNHLGDTDGDPATLNHGLTSMLKRVDVAAYDAVKDVVAGNFVGGIQSLGLSEGGVGYALDDYNRELIDETLISELKSIEEDLISGKIIINRRWRNPSMQGQR